MLCGTEETLVVLFRVRHQFRYEFRRRSGLKQAQGWDTGSLRMMDTVTF